MRLQQRQEAEEAAAAAAAAAHDAAQHQHDGKDNNGFSDPAAGAASGHHISPGPPASHGALGSGFLASVLNSVWHPSSNRAHSGPQAHYLNAPGTGSARSAAFLAGSAVPRSRSDPHHPAALLAATPAPPPPLPGEWHSQHPQQQHGGGAGGGGGIPASASANQLLLQTTSSQHAATLGASGRTSSPGPPSGAHAGERLRLPPCCNCASHTGPMVAGTRESTVCLCVRVCRGGGARRRGGAQGPAAVAAGTEPRPPHQHGAVHAQGPAGGGRPRAAGSQRAAGLALLQLHHDARRRSA